ncbi:lytic transglycosylase domain-containing protein [Solidesulfovibrio sp.]
MCRPGIHSFSDQFGAVMLALALAALCLAAPARAAALQPRPWMPPPRPEAAPLPRSAKLGVDEDSLPGGRAVKIPAGSGEALRDLVLGVSEVLAGKHRQGAARLQAVLPKAGDQADVAAYYQGLGLYLADDAPAALVALEGLAARAGSSFLGRDALYLAMESAARAGRHDRALALAEAWLADAEPNLAPAVWLRAAVAADGLGQRRKAEDFLRHLTLTFPASRSAAAGLALARRLAAEDGGEAVFDPDAPDTVLLLAEALVEKGRSEAALTLLDGRPGWSAPQAARAAYVRGKALYRLRRSKAAYEAFAQAVAADPAANLAGWARYHQARCLWRSLAAEDAGRMEALLREVLAAPGRDDPLREVAARHLALLLAERGRFAEALEAAGRLQGLAVGPELAGQGASLAAILRYVTGDMAGAEAELAAFGQRFPDDDWADGARYWRGRALAGLGRTREAAAVWMAVAAARPNTYYGGRAAAALAGSGDAGERVVASLPTTPPRCPDAAEPPLPAVSATLGKAYALADAGLPALAEMVLEFAARAAPGRADLAMAHIRAALESGRRTAAMRTAWRTFGSCLARGTPAELAPLREALYPRAYAGEVTAALAGSGIDPDIVYSLIRQESFFDPKAVSGAGAVGLMQLMPETAKAVGKKIGIRPGRDDLFNPVVNIRLGVAFFRERLAREGSLAAALASYNAGENRVAVWNAGFGSLGEELFIELIPYTETRDYVRRITANAMLYARLY